MLDIKTYCFTCTYTAFAHFPTCCQTLQDILFGFILHWSLIYLIHPPGSMFAPKIIILTFYGDTCIL